MTKTLEELGNASRRIIIAGGGVVAAGAGKQRVELAELRSLRSEVAGLRSIKSEVAELLTVLARLDGTETPRGRPSAAGR